MKPQVFIDGEAGTTGLQIRQRLEGRGDLSLLSIPADRRKDAGHRAELLNEADLVVLCLPDGAAREAVSLIANPKVKVIDASTAHRTAPGWVYGFAEMDASQEQRIAEARFVANPGCYPTGTIAMLRPRVSGGLMPADYPVSVHAVSGYSGGGRKLIEQFEDPASADSIGSAFYLYGLDLAHKHMAEMTAHALLSSPPVFVPSVARFRQGMIVQIGLHLAHLTAMPTADDVQAALADWYRDADHVTVEPIHRGARTLRLDPEELNGTNDLTIRVFAGDAGDQVLLAATYDNLGKGASGAAVQNLNIMLGLDRSLGLVAA